jgi:hypothetical protein
LIERLVDENLRSDETEVIGEGGKSLTVKWSAMMRLAELTISLTTCCKGLEPTQADAILFTGIQMMLWELTYPQSHMQEAGRQR